MMSLVTVGITATKMRHHINGSDRNVHSARLDMNSGVTRSDGNGRLNERLDLGTMLRHANSKRGWLAESYTMRHWDVASCTAPDSHGEVVVSPNVAYVYEYQKKKGPEDIYVYDDGMFGHDEVTKWPSMLTLPRDAHLACIPLAPVYRNNYTYDPFPGQLGHLSWKRIEPAWMSITRKAFKAAHVHKSEDRRPYFVFDKPIVSAFQDTVAYLKGFVANLQPQHFRSRGRYEGLQTCLRGYYQRLDELLALMRSPLPDLYMILLTRARDAQRLILEVLGHLVMQLIVDRRYSENTSPPEGVLPCLGCFVTSPSDLFWLYRCGVPVWTRLSRNHLESQDVRVYNANQTPLDITCLLSLTAPTLEDRASGLPPSLTIKRSDKPVNGSRPLLKREVPHGGTHSNVILLPNHTDSMAVAYQEGQLLDWLVKQPPECELEDRLPSSPNVTNGNITISSTIDMNSGMAHQRVTIPNFTVTLQQSASSTGRFKFNVPSRALFGDLLGKMPIHSTSRVFQPFLIAAGRLQRQLSPWPAIPAGLYSFPPPSVFLKDNMDPFERLDRFLRWLNLRPMWAFAVFLGALPKVEPLTSAVWRALLTADKRDESKRKQARTKRGQRRSQQRDKIIEKAQSVQALFPQLEFSEKSSLSATWREECFDEEKLSRRPDVRQEILFEVHWLNFMADFFSLDAAEMQVSNSQLDERRHTFLESFGGAILFDPDNANILDVWGAESNQRFLYLKPWFRLIQDWPKCPKALKRDIESVLPNDATEFEQGMVSTFVSFFVLRFHRWPVAPMLQPLSLTNSKRMRETPGFNT